MKLSGHLSIAKVLDSQKTSGASDVYSFGIIVWEIFSRDVPWANVVRGHDIYLRVVIKGERPSIPDDTPVDIAHLMRSCWVEGPEERPTSAQILADMEADGWRE